MEVDREKLTMRVGHNIKNSDRDFPGGPVAKRPHSQKEGPGQGTRSHMPQLRPCMLQLRSDADK